MPPNPEAMMVDAVIFLVLGVAIVVCDMVLLVEPRVSSVGLMVVSLS
jgi:hypothetical protein